MDEFDKRKRNEKAREMARRRRLISDRFQSLVTRLYRSANGTDPVLTSDAEKEGMKALVTFAVDHQINEDGTDAAIPRELEAELAHLFATQLSMFEVARRVVPGFPKPLSDHRHVWIFYGGEAYHRYGDCTALQEGRRKAGRDETTGLTRLRVDKARATSGYEVSERRPCKVCLP